MSILQSASFDIFNVYKLLCKFSNGFKPLIKRTIDVRSYFHLAIDKTHKAYELQCPSYLVSNYSTSQNHLNYDYNSQLSNYNKNALFYLSNEESDKILNMLMNELNISKEEALSFIVKFNFYKNLKKNIHVDGLYQWIVTTKKYFQIQDIITCDKLLLYTHKEIEILIEILTEMNINCSSPIMLELFECLDNLNEFILKHFKIIEQNNNLVKNLLDKIENYPLTRKEKLIYKLKNSSLQDIFCALLHDILDYYKFNFVLKMNYFSPSKLFKICQQFKKYEFPLLLHNDIINKLVYSLNEELDYFFNFFNDKPELLYSLLNDKRFNANSLSTITDNMNLLINKYNFTDKNIEHSSYFLTMPSKQLKEKLDYIISTFNLSPMQIHNYSHYLKKPLKDIKSYSTLRKNSLFKMFKNSNGRISKKTIKIIIDFLFPECSKEKKLEILNNLKSHPRYNLLRSQNNLSQLFESWKYLDNSELSKDQIIKNPTIIFYTVDEVKVALMELKQRSDYDEWKNNEKFLIMLMYLIEKKNPFGLLELNMLKIF